MNVGTGERSSRWGEGLLLSKLALICLFRSGFVEDYTGAGWELVRQESMGTRALALPSQQGYMPLCWELQREARAVLWGVERGKKLIFCSGGETCGPGTVLGGSGGCCADGLCHSEAWGLAKRWETSGCRRCSDFPGPQARSSELTHGLSSAVLCLAGGGMLGLGRGGNPFPQ